MHYRPYECSFWRTNPDNPMWSCASPLHICAIRVIGNCPAAKMNQSQKERWANEIATLTREHLEEALESLDERIPFKPTHLKATWYGKGTHPNPSALMGRCKFLTDAVGAALELSEEEIKNLTILEPEYKQPLEKGSKHLELVFANLDYEFK